MTADLSTAAGRHQAISELLDLTRADLKPGEVQQVVSSLGAGEWRLALEFLLDAIVEEDVLLQRETFTRVEALAAALNTDRGMGYVRKNLVID